MPAIFNYDIYINGEVTAKARPQAIRIETEGGYPLQLKRFNKRLSSETASYILSPAQRAAFEDVWHPTNGHNQFDFVTSVGAAVQGRIVGGDYSMSPEDHMHSCYRLTVIVEYLQ